MIHRLSLCTVLVASASFASADVLNFDDLGLADGTEVTTQYPGVTFSAPGNNTTRVVTASNPLFPNEPQGLYNDPEFVQPIIVDFSSTQSAAGAFIDFGSTGSGIKIEAFDGPGGSGNLLGSDTTVTESFIGVEASGIRSVVFSQAGSNATYLIDNLTITPEGTRLIKFELPETGERDITSRVITSDGVDLLIDNPNGNTLFGDNSFAFILGGLFIDGGLAPNLDWTFSEDVRLVEYTIANQDNTDLFDLVQGNLSSLRQVTDPANTTFPFTNTTDTFLAGQPISLTTSDHSGGGYSINSIVVEVGPGGGCPADLDGDNDVDADDFFAFLDAFASGNLSVCDIDENGACDSADFFEYLDLFVQGC